MLETLNVAKTIDTPSDLVWAVIAGIGGLDRWFSVIESCGVERAGVGAARFVHLAGGGEVKDRIEDIDHYRRRLQYSRTRSPFPVNSYVGVVEVHPVSKGRADVSWAVDIAVTPETGDEMAALLMGALSDGVSGLERDVL